jgi:arsenite methyltransferase
MKFTLEKVNYGLDAPEIIRRWGIYGLISLVATISLAIYLPSNWVATIVVTLMVCVTASIFMPVATILAGSLYFKFREREWLFDNLSLQGNENVLDVGCGHGLLLIGAAKRLNSGKAIGLDLWVQADQAHNTKDATLMNAKIEGVGNRVEVHSGDMREMPFDGEKFDVVISSWAIHNIYDPLEREKALTEIIRVLKSGGRIVILDIDHAESYKDFFIKKGLREVQLLGPRYTFGNKTYLVMARK